jgi:hypothetical protein
LHGVGLGGNEREDRGAVGGCYGNQALAGLELDVVGEVEAELVEVEAEAAVEIANEDLGGMDAEVGGGRRSGWDACGHGEDYKTGRGSEEKDNSETFGNSNKEKGLFFVGDLRKRQRPPA